MKIILSLFFVLLHSVLSYAYNQFPFVKYQVENGLSHNTVWYPIPVSYTHLYLKTISAKDPVYRNTRKLVWSHDNPFFFKGKACEGIGGPHIGYDMIWPMSIIMRAFPLKKKGLS